MSHCTIPHTIAQATRFIACTRKYRMENKCIYRYVYLMHYKQLSPLHVSAAYLAIFREVFFEVYITL